MRYFLLQKCGPGTGQFSTIYPCLGAARRAADSALSNAFGDCINETTVLDTESVCGRKSGPSTNTESILFTTAAATGYSTQSTTLEDPNIVEMLQTTAAGAYLYSISLSLTLQSMSLADFNMTRQTQLRQVKRCFNLATFYLNGPKQMYLCCDHSLFQRIKLFLAYAYVILALHFAS